MATMNVSLPAKLKDWVEERASEGTYANASDYVRDLIRRDHERQIAIAGLRAEIQMGLDSGVSTRSPQELRKYAMAKVRASSAGRKQRVNAG
jgi:antitoxin ParD1/3/4